MEYDRRRLAHAYLEAYQKPQVPAGPFADQLETYYAQMLAGLKQLFGFELESDQLIYFFFRSVANSYLSNTYPLARMLEGGLLYQRVEGSDAMKVVGELREMHEVAARRHVDLVVMLLDLVKPDTGETFTTEDLEAIGVNTEEPTDPDDEWY